MQVSDDLKHEHQLILKYIELMERYIDFGQAYNNNELFGDKAEAFIHFIQNFADTFHHAKEEDVLFKHMAAPDVLTHCNPLPQMLMEHDLGRGCVQRMKDALSKDDWDSLAKSAREYGVILREHIFKEDNILFPMAEESIADANKKSAKEEYAQAEARLDGSALWKEHETKFAELEMDFENALSKEMALA